jgi:hypothetical protein
MVNRWGRKAFVALDGRTQPAPRYRLSLLAHNVYYVKLLAQIPSPRVNSGQLSARARELHRRPLALKSRAPYSGSDVITTITASTARPRPTPSVRCLKNY